MFALCLLNISFKSNFVYSVSAACYLVAVIVFAVEFDSTFAANPTVDQELGYSWGIALVTLLFNGLGVGVCQIMEGRGATKDWW